MYSTNTDNLTVQEQAGVGEALAAAVTPGPWSVLDLQQAYADLVEMSALQSMGLPTRVQAHPLAKSIHGFLRRTGGTRKERGKRVNALDGLCEFGFKGFVGVLAQALADMRKGEVRLGLPITFSAWLSKQLPATYLALGQERLQALESAYPQRWALAKERAFSSKNVASVKAELAEQRSAQKAAAAKLLRVEAAAEKGERQARAKAKLDSARVAAQGELCSMAAKGLTAEQWHGLRQQFAALGESLTLPKVRQLMSKDGYAALRLDLAAHRAKNQAERAFRATLVPSWDMPTALGCTPADYRRALLSGLLGEPFEQREFRKWGKTLRAPMFTPESVERAKASLPEWRKAWTAQTAQRRSLGAKKAAAVAATRAQTRASAGLDLKSWPRSFAPARAIGRRWLAILGPTNSGKTQRAIQTLAAAPSGVYLAPLRLLALEVYERLLKMGVAVSLITGEEQVINPEATHTCATVECADLSTAVEVGVVDEVQMLGDDLRGWAWTQALLGLPARQLVCVGSEAYGSLLRLAAKSCGEDIEFAPPAQRLGPLEPLLRAVALDELKAGDAVIAFSRNDVLQHAQSISQSGRSVAIIYGGLSPEVRREQARRFSSGKASVLVATDAIGQGLNLPIGRCLFADATKFDGQMRRPLRADEVQQIAGRAGRGSSEGRFGGYAASRHGSDAHRHVVSVFDEATASPKNRFWVRPTLSQLRAIEPDTDQCTWLVRALDRFGSLCNSGRYVAQVDDMRAVAADIESLALTPEVAFDLCCSPSDDLGLVRLVAQSIKVGSAFSWGLVMPQVQARPVAKGSELAQLERLLKRLGFAFWCERRWPQFASGEDLDRLRAFANARIIELLAPDIVKAGLLVDDPWHRPRRHHRGADRFHTADDFDFDFDSAEDVY